MSSTFVADTTEDQKTENPLIIIVHNDGTVSVDHETLQNLIVNQQTRPVSLVRLGPPTQGDDSSQDSNGTCDSQNDGNPHVNLTVEGFYSPPQTVQPCPTEGAGENLVDPFLEMDPEQLERLETALQSEQAKQILGENVTAMLDMLSVDEEAAQITDSIRMDHCYTNLSPSSAPLTSTPNHQYGPVGNSDTDNSDNSDITPPHQTGITLQQHSTSTTFQQQEQQQQQQSQESLQLSKIQHQTSVVISRARGRGRGPGRPRKDVSAVRSTSYRSASGRGRGSRTVRGGANVAAKTATHIAPGMVMVQQIKPINPPLAPPPSTPSSASLVPLIKPLVMTPGQHGTIATTAAGLSGVQKQVVAVPVSSGGTRLVTVSGAKLGQVLTTAGGQQRVLVTRPMQQSSQQPVQATQHSPAQTSVTVSCTSPSSLTAKVASSMTDNDVTSTAATSSNHLAAQQDVVSSSVIAGMSAPKGQAKVLVAKMPTIPPQLLGAQPSSGLSDVFEADKLQDNEADFTHFSGNEGEDVDAASDDESDDGGMDSDDDYIEPGRRRGGRFGGKQRGGRGGRRVTRGARTRGSVRYSDRSTNLRGSVAVKRRGGRGRGMPGRPEEIERAQRLEAEMAAALVAMDKSSDKEEEILERVPKPSLIQEADSLCMQEDHMDHLMPSAAKKAVTNSDDKTKVAQKKEGDASETKKTKEKIIFPTSQTSPPGNQASITSHNMAQNKQDKKNSVKSPSKKHFTNVSQSASSNVIPAQELTKTETRKNYPKRENRKPPAHLAEAFGPALFSTPDIIRRVSIGGEQKTSPVTPETPPTEMKKECDNPISSKESPEMKMITTSVATPVLQRESDGLEEADPALSDDLGSALQVPEDHGVLDTLQVEALKTEEELLADTILLQQHINEDTMETETTEEVKSNSASKVEELVSSTDDKDDIAKTARQSLNKNDSKSLIPAPLAAARSTRRRNSAQQDTLQKSAKPVTQRQQQGTAKERRKSDDSKARGRARNKGRLPDAETVSVENEADEDEEEDSEAESSDDESWNSEDDPDRLWCICKKPHNNRFMICCDVCEDWFHGKCVGVTKSMGQQMEEKGLEWCCPNCIKKRETESKDKGRELKRQTKAIKEKKSAIKGASTQHGAIKDIEEEANKDVFNAATELTSKIVPTSKQSRTSGENNVMKCIACEKEARPTSIYCSDACVLKHVQESLNAANKDKSALSSKVAPFSTADNAAVAGKTQSQPTVSKAVDSAQLPKARPDARIMVFERKTGKLLAGPNAPTAANLKAWLKDNPTFEVVRPGVLPTNKYYNQKTISHSGKQQAARNASAQPKVALIHKPAALPAKSAPAQSKPALTTVGTKQQITPIAGKQQKLGTPGPLSVNVSKEAAALNKSSMKSTGSLRSPTGAPKTPTKSPVPGGIGSSVQQTKTAPAPVVSKAPATSTVKEVITSKAQTPAVTKKIEAKRSSLALLIETPKKEEEKPAGPEPIRLNVRKTLQELLQARIQECSDLSASDEDVQKIALHIEEEMHSYFRDTGIKYKSKYRSLVFNIKDPKNLTLFRKIADRSLTPHQLVRLSPEELASQELAQWREREAKHQIEMIKKNELDLMTLSKTYVMKTHKGEQVIETDETMKADVPELVDPTAVPDIVSALNNSVSSTVEDVGLEQENTKIRERDKTKENKDKDEKRMDKDSSSKERERSKRDDRKNDRDRRGHSREREGSRRSRHDSFSSRSEREKKGHERGKSSSRNKHHHHHHSEKERERSRKEKYDDDSKKEDTKIKRDDDRTNKIEFKVSSEAEIKKEPAHMSEVKPKSIVDVKQEYDSDMSDREPSSTVTIKTPDINTDDSHSISINTVEDKPGTGATVWKGFVNMPDVAKFFTTVQVVSGDPQNLCKDLPDTVDIVGRISPETVWDYIAKMKKSGTKEILVIRLIAANDEEKIPYITLYTYLNMRKRLGVVGNVSKMIKDFYIMPLASHNPVPQVLLPLDGPGFEDQRSYMLLGILVRARRKRLAPELTYVAKVPKRPPPAPVPIPDLVERSYTPPLPGTVETSGSLTPPHPPPSADKNPGYTPPHSPKHISYGPSNLDPRLAHKVNKAIDKDVVKHEKEENDVNVLPSSVQQNFELPLSVEDNDNDDDDDDAPYSPGGGMDENNGESSEDNLLATPKNSSDLQRKMEELNRKIEEQKQQIQSISSAIGTDAAVVIEPSSMEPAQVHGFIMNTVEDSKVNIPDTVNSPAPLEDENEAYSPSRSFTPPAVDTIPFIGPSEETTPSVLSSLPSNISIPSNLGEILASIKKRETDASAATSNKVISLKEDPIVQSYGESSTDTDPSKMESEDMAYDPSSAVYATGRNSPYPSISQGINSSVPHTTASSVVPALLSLSTPVVHSLSTLSTKLEGKQIRDPRQKSSDTAKSSTLSSLSDDDLIKKAMEMELEAAATGMANSSLQQPLPPGVDNFPPPQLQMLPPSGAVPSPPIKGMPTSQPLPPGLEEEEYPSYSSSFVPPPPSAPAVTQTRSLPSASQAVTYSVRPNYRMPPHHYNSQSYNMAGPPPPPPPPPQGGNFNGPYVSGAPVMYSGDRNIMEDSGGMRNKRKYQDMDGDANLGLDMRGEIPKEVRGREAWEQKVPVPMQGRYNPRNLRGRDRFPPRGNPHRNFSRQRGGRNGPPHRSRWGLMGKNEDRSSRYDANIRSQWDSHIKDFEEKFRERTKYRERDRERSSNSGRSYGGGSRSSKIRNSDSEDST